MDIDSKMVELIKNREQNPFGIFSDKVYEGIDLGKIREKIGFKSIDLAPYTKSTSFLVNDIFCYKYFNNESSDDVIFYIHGGGFYGGDPIIVENPCKYMANYSNSHVISIQYTLAPDKKFPDTMHEIYDIIKEILEKNKYKKVGIIGDSAGAHLSFNVAYLDKMEKQYIDFVALIYPVISLEQIENWSLDMYDLKEPCENAKAMILFLKSIMPLIKKLYLNDNYKDFQKYYNLLNLEKEDFDFSKVFVIKAGFDYYNPHIDLFCKKYNINNICYDTMAHGFIEFLGHLDEVQDMIEKVADKFKGV